MTDQPSAPKTLKLKIRIPALKKDPPLREPTPPPPPQPEPALDSSDGEDDDNTGSQSPSRSGSPISLENRADDDIETAYDLPPSTTQSQPSFTPTLKLKFSTASKSIAAPQTPGEKKPKKPRARQKLFGRVTERKGPAVGPDGQPVYHAKKQPKLKSITEILPRLLARIKKKDHYGIFLQPVDTTAFPHYLDIIKIPMDLSTMEKTLESGKYRSLDQFAADFRLMINNCKTFNPSPSLYHTEATKIESFGNDAISQAAGQLMDPADEPEHPPPTAVLPQQERAKSSPNPDHPPSPAVVTTTTLSGRTVKKAVYNETEPPNSSLSFTPTHTPSNSVSKPGGTGGAGVGATRGPYKKTVTRDVPVVGPGGELPGSANGVGEFEVGSEWGKVALALEIRGKRYRTKKERLEMEKRGMPTLWDGSIDYAQLEDPFTILHHFTPDPFQAPWLQSLSSQSNDVDDFPIHTHPAKLAEATDKLPTAQASSAYFINRGYSTRAGVPTMTLDAGEAAVQGEVAAEVSERWAGVGDWGVNLADAYGGSDKTKVRKVVQDEEVRGLKDEVKDGVEYIRDTVYGGTDGLAYARSLMAFVDGAGAGVARRRAVEEEEEKKAHVRVGDVRMEEDVEPPKVEDVKPHQPEDEKEGDDWEWEEPPGGLGMSLQDWITQNVIQPATRGMHDVLATTAHHLRSPPSPPTNPLLEDEEEGGTDDLDPISTRIYQHHHVFPGVRKHLEGIATRRTQKINLADLIKDPSGADLRVSDEVWDPVGAGSGVGGKGTVRLGFDGKWAERALGLAAGRVDEYARQRELGEVGGGVKMDVDGEEEESEEVRKLRFNLLALARVVPFSEGVTFG